jgi:ABC-type sugar transport system ATPase subunit
MVVDERAPAVAAPVPTAGPSADGPGESLLRMRGITKDFSGGRVLHGVDLDVRAGAVHALVGENGAGKSTLMKILAGVYPDYGGAISIGGTEVPMRSPRVGLEHGVAVIYQENSLVPDLTVAENIGLGREERTRVPGGFARRATGRRSGADAEDLGIDLPMDARVRDLDVGQQQMCEIVKAVSRRARILVMDEPTARLSMTQRDSLFAIVRRLADRGVGIVYISHFLVESFAVCAAAPVPRDGRVVASRPLAELSVEGLAHLMVGDRYEAIERDTARNLDAGDAADGRPVVLALQDVAVPGAVEPLSLDVREGEVVGFAGLQGSGRSDLARALIGAAPGASGSLRVGEEVGLPKDPRAAVGVGILMLPASRKTDGIVETRSVRHNVELTALRDRLHRFGWRRGREAGRVVDDMLERFGVRPRNPDLGITALSGGNQQKVLFARAAAAGARVLVLDQPTAGVDIGAKVELYEQIERLTAEGVAIVLISDDLTELLRLSDRIIIMRRGRASAPAPAGTYDRTTLLSAITGGAPEVAA